ncbi:hypothetical protein PINS_up019536 [Pythium insidiosum]|nr:hypothetical protein PINS_up004349 [Pythium insidiosum]GLE08375.1 hypothetical protein PINS_up019536 [Pythium insidiosum]
MARDVNEIRRQERVDASDPAFDKLSKIDGHRYASPEYDHRRKRFPVRTGIAALSLFTLGSILIYVSTLFGLDDESRGLSFFILGLIAFIPGSYATVQLYGSYKGWKGYDYSQIPSYDD